MIKRNTIIILGNGFDVAHNFPTKYSDFANHQLEVISNNLINENKDQIISDSFIKFQQFYFRLRRPDVNNSNHKKLLKLVLIIDKNDVQKVSNFLNSNLDLMNSIISNHFLAKLYANNYNNWFDIENAFFEELIKIKTELINYLNNVNANPSKRTSGELKQYIELKKIEIKKLNGELKEIKNALKLYLNSIELIPNKKIEEFFINAVKDIQNVKNIQIINFNYTNTIDLYLKFFKQRGHKVEVLNIHGNLNEEIIFGYGNDNNNDYQTMQDLEIDEFLENFKTFEYLNNNRYSNFFKNTLPELRLYNVIVLGHSLQQTDKTLLSGVINNSGCLEISLLKRGDLEEPEKHKAYRKLTFAISRILKTNNDELRLKVVDYKNLNTFP